MHEAYAVSNSLLRVLIHEATISLLRRYLEHEDNAPCGRIPFWCIKIPDSDDHQRRTKKTKYTFVWTVSPEDLSSKNSVSF